MSSTPPHLLAQLLRVPTGDDGEPQWPASTQDVIEMAKARAQIAERALAVQAPSIPVLSAVPSQGAAVGRGRGYGTGVVDFRTLRYIRESSPIVIGIHEARQHQLQRYSSKSYGQPGQVGWRVVHKEHRNPAQVVPKRFEGPIKQAEAILSRSVPDARVHGVGDVLRGLWDDYAGLNRPVLECLNDTDGQFAAIRPTDGGMVWESSAYLQWWASGRMGQIAKMAHLNETELLDWASRSIPVKTAGAADLFRHRYLWVEDDVVIRGFTDQELIVGTALTSTDVRYGPYPPSKLERALNLSVWVDQVIEYNVRFFTDGMQANWLFFLPPDLRQEAMAALSQAFAERTQGNVGAHKPAILGAEAKDITAVNLTPGLPKDYAFEGLMSFLSALHCAIYQIDPSSVYFKPWGAGQAPSLNEANRSEEIAGSREGGLPGDLEHLRMACLNPVVRRIHPDLEVVIDTGDYDPKKALEILDLELKTVKTRNQAIVQKGDKPIGPYVSPEDWDEADPARQAAHLSNPYNHVGSPMEAIQLAQTMQGLLQPNQGQDPNAGGARPGEEPDLDFDDDAFADDEPEPPPRRGR